MEIILCIRARHGIIRGGTHFALPRDYHHPSGSGEQLCWVGGRGSAEGRPKLIPRIPPITGGAAASPRALRAPRYSREKEVQGCPAGRDGAGMSLALLLQGPAAAEPRLGWEEPGMHWLRGAGSDWPGAALQANVICWQNLGGRCPSLSLARGGMQEHGPATSATPGSGCHLQQRGRARLGSGIPWEMANPGFLTRRFPARCLTSHRTRDTNI